MERLRNMDGETLLNTMHVQGNRDSLVYWLEFKSDAEFPTRKFGSISGGSALKFGLYKNKESGEWMTGSPQKQITLTVEEAVKFARKHRDQLIAAVELLQKLPAENDDQAYLSLQQKMDEAAPDVSRLAWGHKYLSLHFPDKLDDYHNEEYQKFNLRKLLQMPPEQPGLYVCAGRFVRLAEMMGWPINHLTSTLNQRHGSPAKYWRIGTKADEGHSIWQDMKAGGYAAIGWARLGDLSTVLEGENPKGKIVEQLRRYYNYDPQVASRKAGEIRNFAGAMNDDDVILAADGERIVGIGRVKGPYRFDPSPPAGAPHRRDVEWLSTAEWKLPVSEGLQTTVWSLHKDDRNLVEIERRLLDTPTSPSIPIRAKAAGRNVRLEGVIPSKVQAILERKGQAILYGPPGTGKTHWARRVAQDLAASSEYGCLFDDLTSEQKATITGNSSIPGVVRLCTFHPAYGYEDFIEGYRPRPSSTGQLIFEQRDGIFKRLCRDASASPERKHILLIDEINRGDIPRIFGELLTLLEKDKRGLEVNLPLWGDRFSVPPNVFIIGTMNTADRSIALLDTALRRRFGFVELMPDSSTLTGAILGEAIPLGPWLDALNTRVREHIGKDARNLQIGHAYLLEDGGKPVTDFAKFTRIVAEDIVPLLEEYCYEDFEALTQILGEALVDKDRQRIRDELFSPARRQDLIQALLAPTPELTTTSEAITQQSIEPDQDEETEEPSN